MKVNGQMYAPANNLCNKQTEAGLDVLERKKNIFSVTIRNPDRSARSPVAILAMLPQLLIIDLVWGKQRIAEENLNLGFVFTDFLSKRVYINSTLRTMCMSTAYCF
jgi:hypothetical protein